MKEIRTNQPNLVVNALNSLLNEKGDLEELARKFPYSLPIQSFISGLNKSQNQLAHSRYLKLSAVISPDRTILYNFIEGNNATSIQALGSESKVETVQVPENDIVVKVLHEPEVKLEETQDTEIELQYIVNQKENDFIALEEPALPLLNPSIEIQDDEIVHGALLELADQKTVEEVATVVHPLIELEEVRVEEKIPENTEVKKEEIPVEMKSPKSVKLDDVVEKELIKVAVDKTIQREVDELIKEIPLEPTFEKIDQKTDPDSFSYWLNPAKSNLESREEKLKKIDSLIEKFIKSEPRIVPKKVDFYSPVNVAKQSVAFDEDLVSEPLAAIFEKQGYFDKAIKAYEKLSLKFPEKRAYFAARIEKIGEIIKNIKNTK